MSPKDRFYTVVEASAALGKSVPTIYRWVSAGKLASARNPMTGRYLIPKEDIERAKEWC